MREPRATRAELRQALERERKRLEQRLREHEIKTAALALIGRALESGSTLQALWFAHDLCWLIPEIEPPEREIIEAWIYELNEAQRAQEAGSR